MAKRRSPQSPQHKPPRTQDLKKHAAAPATAALSFGWLTERPGTIAVALIAVHLVLALLAFEPAPHNGGDNAAYYALARSLLSGNGYREIYDPAMPLHTQYPPVFPAMLAGLLLLGFHPWVPFKLLVVACSAAAIGLSYFWIRRKLRPDLALPVTALMALSPGVLLLSHQELSDVPFWTFTIAALLAWERLGPRNTKRLCVATALTLLAYFTRSAGLPLIGAVVAWLLWRRRWKQLVIFGAGIAPFVFWWWLRARTQGGVDYVQQFWFVNPYQAELGRVGALDLVTRAWNNTQAYYVRHFPVLLVGMAALLTQILGLFVVALAFFGWVKRLRHAHVSELFLPLYCGLVLAWPAVWSGERFILPLLPLLLFYAAEGLQRALRLIAPTQVRLASLAALAVVVLCAMPALVQRIRWGQQCTREYLLGDRYSCHHPQFQDIFHTAELSARILPERSVVLSRKPRLFWGISGLQGRIYPFSREPDSLLIAARNAGARYLLLDRAHAQSELYLMPILVRRPRAFCIVYSQGADRSALFGIKPRSDTIPDQSADPGTAEREIAFELCGPEYWKSRAVMDSVLSSR